MSLKTLEIFMAFVDDALRTQSLKIRQNKAGEILSEAHKHLTRKEFKELEKYAFEKLVN